MPFGINFQMWVSQLIVTFPKENIPLAFPTKDWWGWVEQLIQIPTFVAAPIPSKKIYKDEDSWRLWAVFFIQLYT